MYNSTLLYKKPKINSVIDNGCNLIEAFNKVLNYFDPNKESNYKTKVLDCTYSRMWTEKDMRLFNIENTKNLSGLVSKNKFDIIIYEPPRNQNFYQDLIKSSKIFASLLTPNGIVIIKMNDFKEKGSNELKGTFDVWDKFSDASFYLQDNIIYNFHKPSNTCDANDRSEIIHLNFMIFKKKQGDSNEV